MIQKIALVISDDLERSKFLSMFKIINTRLSYHWEVSSNEKNDQIKADYVIVDKEYNRKNIQRYQAAFPDSSLVIYAKEPPPDDTPYISKPIHANNLIGVLNRDKSPALTPLTLVKNDKSPFVFLPEYLLSIVNSSNCPKIWYENDIPIFACSPDEQFVAVRKDLFGFQFHKDHSSSFRLVNSGVPADSHCIEKLACTNGFIRCSLLQFQWLCYLTLSNGILHRDIAKGAIISLVQWPEFTRLEHKPKDLLLAAALIKQPMSVQQLAHHTHVSIKQTIGFINACYLDGRLAITSGDVTNHDVLKSNVHENKNTRTNDCIVTADINFDVSKTGAKTELIEKMMNKIVKAS